MSKQVKITVENRLTEERRDMNVYHHSTRSAHMISHDSYITLPLKPVIEDDYLHISIVSGPGRLEGNCIVNLPSWLDFEFSSEGDVIIAHTTDRTLLKVPPGQPLWQLKMTCPLYYFIEKSTDRITIGQEL